MLLVIFIKKNTPKTIDDPATQWTDRKIHMNKLNINQQNRKEMCSYFKCITFLFGLLIVFKYLFLL